MVGLSFTKILPVAKRSYYRFFIGKTNKKNLISEQENELRRCGKS